MQLFHPEVAYRSCDDCRRWFYDPKTGERRKSRTGGYLKRQSESSLPCVSDECPKGDYKKPIESSLEIDRTLTLYRHAKATGGRSLTTAEAKDRLLAEAFALLDDLERVASESRTLSQLAMAGIGAGSART